MRSMRLLAVIAVGTVVLGFCACTPTVVETDHYLGVFDPQTQLPQELYRVSIRGRSSGVSKADYASGWVPAEAADLLTRQIVKRDNREIRFTEGAQGEVTFPPLRTLYEIGPTGVSTSPEDGRFVIVMGSNPDHFFQKMSAVAGSVTGGASEEDHQAALTSAKSKLVEKRMELLSTRRAVAEELASAQVERHKRIEIGRHEGTVAGAVEGEKAGRKAAKEIAAEVFISRAALTGEQKSAIEEAGARAGRDAGADEGAEAGAKAGANATDEKTAKADGEREGKAAGQKAGKTAGEKAANAKIEKLKKGAGNGS